MSTPRELYDEADRLKRSGDLAGAVAKLNELLTETPGFALAHSALAVLKEKLGNFEEAIEHAKRACSLEPDDAFSYTALSVTYQRAFAGTGKREYIAMAEEAMARSRMLSGH